MLALCKPSSPGKLLPLQLLLAQAAIWMISLLLLLLLRVSTSAATTSSHAAMMIAAHIANIAWPPKRSFRTPPIKAPRPCPTPK
jgi:hypothetical protein